MSDTITWAVLSDGRYIKVMVHNGTGTKFSVLDADKNEALAQLCYQMVNCKPMLSGKETAESEKINFIQLHADFLMTHCLLPHHRLLLNHCGMPCRNS